MELREKVNRRLIIEVFLIGILIWVMFVALNWLGVYLQQDKIKLLISQAGLIGPLLYAAIYLISVIIAPFPGFAAYVVTAGVYGVGKTVLFTYALSLVGATINFAIASILEDQL